MWSPAQMHMSDSTTPASKGFPHSFGQVRVPFSPRAPPGRSSPSPPASPSATLAQSLARFRAIKAVTEEAQLTGKGLLPAQQLGHGVSLTSEASALHDMNLAILLALATARACSAIAAGITAACAVAAGTPAPQSVLLRYGGAWMELLELTAPVLSLQPASARMPEPVVMAQPTRLLASQLLQESLGAIVPALSKAASTPALRALDDIIATCLLYGAQVAQNIVLGDHLAQLLGKSPEQALPRAVPRCDLRSAIEAVCNSSAGLPVPSIDTAREWMTRAGTKMQLPASVQRAQHATLPAAWLTTLSTLAWQQGARWLPLHPLHAAFGTLRSNAMTQRQCRLATAQLQASIRSALLRAAWRAWAVEAAASRLAARARARRGVKLWATHTQRTRHAVQLDLRAMRFSWTTHAARAVQTWRTATGTRRQRAIRSVAAASASRAHRLRGALLAWQRWAAARSAGSKQARQRELRHACQALQAWRGYAQGAKADKQRDYQASQHYQRAQLAASFRHWHKLQWQAGQLVQAMAHDCARTQRSALATWRKHAACTQRQGMAAGMLAAALPGILLRLAWRAWTQHTAELRADAAWRGRQCQRTVALLRQHAQERTAWRRQCWAAAMAISGARQRRALALWAVQARATRLRRAAAKLHLHATLRKAFSALQHRARTRLRSRAVWQLAAQQDRMRCQRRAFHAFCELREIRNQPLTTEILLADVLPASTRSALTSARSACLRRAWSVWRAETTRSKDLVALSDALLSARHIRAVRTAVRAWHHQAEQSLVLHGTARHGTECPATRPSRRAPHASRVPRSTAVAARSTWMHGHPDTQDGMMHAAFEHWMLQVQRVQHVRACLTLGDLHWRTRKLRQAVRWWASRATRAHAEADTLRAADGYHAFTVIRRAFRRWQRSAAIGAPADLLELLSAGSSGTDSSQRLHAAASPVSSSASERRSPA